MKRNLLLLLFTAFYLTTYAQGNYILKFVHKGYHGKEEFNFYLERVEDGPITQEGDRNLNIDSERYLVSYVRFFEPFARSFADCCLYQNQTPGETTFPDSILQKYSRIMEAMSNDRLKGVFGFKINKFDRVEFLKGKLKYCKCKAYRERPSINYDSIIIPTQLFNVQALDRMEKKRLQKETFYILQNEFIKNCLPDPTKYLLVRRRKK